MSLCFCRNNQKYDQKCDYYERTPAEFVYILQNKARFQEGGVLLTAECFWNLRAPWGGSDVMRKQPFCAGPLIRGQITKWITVESMINNVGLDCFVMRIVIHVDLSRVSIPFEVYAARSE